MKKYADPEWSRLKAEEKSLEWKQAQDPVFQMRKDQYEMSKAYAEMRYKSDPKYSQAKYAYEAADCEADFSKFHDPVIGAHQRLELQWGQQRVHRLANTLHC